MEKTEMNMEIIENDEDMITFKINNKSYVYNKHYGYFYDSEKCDIVKFDEELMNILFKKFEYSNSLIEDFPYFVYKEVKK